MSNPPLATGIPSTLRVRDVEWRRPAGCGDEEDNALRPVPYGQESLLVGRWTDHLPTREDYDGARPSAYIG